MPKNSNLNIIEKAAFSNTNITYFYFPSKLTKIEEEAFSLSNLQVPDFLPSIKLKLIEKSVFSYTLIEKVQIPLSVSILDNLSFINCERLKCVEFQSDSNLEIIEFGVFERSNLKSISIPSKTIKIGKHAFHDCDNFFVIEILGENRSIEISKEAFLNVSNNFSLFASKTVTIKLILINKSLLLLLLFFHYR